MPLTTDLTDALSGGVPEKQCKLYHLGLSPDEMEAVLQYIDAIRQDHKRDQPHKYFTVVGLKRILNANGFKVGKTVISEHVRKVCVCER